MKKFIILVLLFPLLSVASDGIGITYDGRGGVTYSIAGRVLDTQSPYNYLVGDELVFPHDPDRPQRCLVGLSDQIPVFHGKGKMDVSINFRVGMLSTMSNRELQRSIAFLLEVETRTGHREHIPVSLGSLNPLFLGYDEEANPSFWLDYDSVRIKNAFSIPLSNTADKVSLSVCKIYPALKLSIRTIRLHTYPTY
jgi:hypothetical protein